MAWGRGVNNRFSDGNRRERSGSDHRLYRVADPYTDGPDTDGSAADRAGPHAEAFDAAAFDDASLDRDDELARFAAMARAEERVAQRRRSRWLARQAEESTTFDGLLTTMFELGQPVEVLTTAGITHRGTVAVVGVDAVGLHTGDGRLTLLALDRVVALDAGDRRDLSAERATPGEAERPSLRVLLAELADERPDVVVGVDGCSLRGTLQWVGEDVLALASAPLGAERHGAGRRTRYIRLSSVAEVSVSVSG